MTIDPLYPFLVVGLFSPGPNVILIAASGARFGFRRSLPHMAGVLLGIAGIAALAGGGISAVLEALPWLRRILGLVATMWILYLAYRLWAVPGIVPHSQAQPMSFVQAALFQWVNPKIWALALTAATAYGAGMPPWQEALRLSLAFVGINSLALSWWGLAGVVLAFLLRTPIAWRLFHKTMALALAFFSFALLRETLG